MDVASRREAILGILHGARSLTSSNSIKVLRCPFGRYIDVFLASAALQGGFSQRSRRLSRNARCVRLIRCSVQCLLCIQIWLNAKVLWHSVSVHAWHAISIASRSTLVFCFSTISCDLSQYILCIAEMLIIDAKVYKIVRNKCLKKDWNSQL